MSNTLYTDDPAEADFEWKYEDGKFFAICVCGAKVKQNALTIILRCTKCHRERRYISVPV